ncbi:MAG: hypothetical protein AAFZ15_17290 [Bacteroidota bacterium]
MKRPIILLCCSILCSFAILSEEKKRLAQPDKIQGIYIFTDSTPVDDYELLGVVKTTVGLSAQYEPIRDKMIKRARKNYPEAEAIIIRMNRGGTDRGEVIKFND